MSFTQWNFQPSYLHLKQNQNKISFSTRLKFFICQTYLLVKLEEEMHHICGREAASVRDHRNDAGSQLLNGHRTTRPPKQCPPLFLCPTLEKEGREVSGRMGEMKCLQVFTLCTNSFLMQWSWVKVGRDQRKLGLNHPIEQEKLGYFKSKKIW